MKGEYDKGLADLNKAIQLAPTGGRCYFNRGFTYLQKGRVREGHCRLRHRHQGDRPITPRRIATAALRRSNGEIVNAALADLNRALRLDPARFGVLYQPRPGLFALGRLGPCGGRLHPRASNRARRRRMPVRSGVRAGDAEKIPGSAGRRESGRQACAAGGFGLFHAGIRLSPSRRSR